MFNVPFCEKKLYVISEMASKERKVKFKENKKFKMKENDICKKQK